MLCLTQPTPARWVEIALANLDAVLVDHAHCEMKAATNALALAGRATDPEMACRLAAIAQEETEHFAQVLELLAKRGLSLGKAPPDPYAAELRAIAHKQRPGGRAPKDILVDRFLVGALIEARSCERFQLLADALTERGHELAPFYRELLAAEAKHFRTFYDLALQAYPDKAYVKARLRELAEAEGELCQKLGNEAEIHG